MCCRCQRGHVGRAKRTSRKSITPDRGKEFVKHAEVTEALEGVKFYFPPPHHPWERGSNENTNGLLREYFPKGQDITDIPDAYIQEMFDKLNRRPRKCLGYRTPYEAYYATTLHLTWQFALQSPLNAYSIHSPYVPQSFFLSDPLGNHTFSWLIEKYTSITYRKSIQMIKEVILPAFQIEYHCAGG